MRHLLFLAVLLLAACESDKAKYDRLSHELWAADLAVTAESVRAEMHKPICPRLVSLPTNAYTAQCAAQIEEHLSRRALARRAMNQFMESR